MNKPLPKTLLPFIGHFIKPYRFAFVIFLTVPMLLVLESTIQPYGIKLIVDGIAVASPGLELIPEVVIKGALIYLGSFMLLVLVFRAQEWYQTLIIPKFTSDIRMQVLDQLSLQSYQYFTNHMSGKLSNKVGDLPAAIDEIRMIFCWSIVAPFTVALSAVVAIALVSPIAAAAFFVWIVLHLMGAIHYSKRVNEMAHLNAEHKSELSGLIVDFLSNMIPVKLFARRRFEVAYVQSMQDIEKESSHKTLRSILRLRIFIDVWAWCMAAALFVALFYTWKQGTITPGELTFVMMTMIAALNQLWFTGQMLAQLFKQIGIAQQALDIIAVPVSIKDDDNAKRLIVSHGKIEFRNVNFHYHRERELFSKMNITIEAGSKVGLVGYSGSGKTTFVHLILRFYDIIDGQILIDGQNIAGVTQDSLHEHIAMVPQDTSLFHRTLLDNIRYGDLNANEAEVIEASKAAHCHEFIMSLPEGYNTLVGERGLKLSGGQRQRIAIARAMLKKAPILILDEATSALDSVTEQYIQDGMSKLMQQRTTIVVAHRLSTLSAMDRILVFEKGHIIEDGSHKDLLAQGGHYAQLWHMQAGGFLPTSLE